MANTIDELLKQINTLETELEKNLEEQRQKFRYSIDRKRVTFESAIRQQHIKMRTGIVRFLLNSGILRIFAAIILYSLIVPIVIFDFAVSLYQFTCFPVYGIAKVPRSLYIIIDHHRLAYLNLIEKVNCVYCSYANGLLAYAREIAGRTEEYFCPIKHAQRMRGQHPRYMDFAEYGDAEGFQKKVKEIDKEAEEERKKFWQSGKDG